MGRKKKVVVAQNTDGEATNGTTKDGDNSEVLNTESIPQNPDNDIETTEPTNDVAEEADESRTEEEKEFSNESNPNQKARTVSQGDSEYDQDGNLRTDGYSYGVAPDDTTGINTKEAFKENEGEKPEPGTGYKGSQDSQVYVAPTPVGDYSNDNSNNPGELDEEDIQKLEKELSDEKNGILARVITSTGAYVKVKFYKDNKPFAIYKSRGFDKKDAKSFLKFQLKGK